MTAANLVQCCADAGFSRDNVKLKYCRMLEESHRILSKSDIISADNTLAKIHLELETYEIEQESKTKK